MNGKEKAKGGIHPARSPTPGGPGAGARGGMDPPPLGTSGELSLRLVRRRRACSLLLPGSSVPKPGFAGKHKDRQRHEGFESELTRISSRRPVLNHSASPERGPGPREARRGWIAIPEVPSSRPPLGRLVERSAGAEPHREWRARPVRSAGRSRGPRGWRVARARAPPLRPAARQRSPCALPVFRAVRSGSPGRAHRGSRPIGPARAPATRAANLQARSVQPPG